MSETTPGGPLYLRGINVELKISSRKTLVTKHLKLRKKSNGEKRNERYELWVNNCNLTILQFSERAIASVISAMH